MKHLDRQEMIDILHKVRDGVLALTDGSLPYCLPFGFVYVNDAVFLSLFPTGRKWEIIKKNSNVCFNAFCWNDENTEWYSVVVEGGLVPVKDLETIESVVRATMQKVGLDPEKYTEKRMEYYSKNLVNDKGLKIFKIDTRSMTGRSMPILIGKDL